MLTISTFFLLTVLLHSLFYSVRLNYLPTVYITDFDWSVLFDFDWSVYTDFDWLVYTDFDWSIYQRVETMQQP